jgi:hypothetical protein
MVLKYSVKKHDGIDARLKHRDPSSGEELELDLPPIVPGTIDCLVAGFPWYVELITEILFFN